MCARTYFSTFFNLIFSSFNYNFRLWCFGFCFCSMFFSEWKRNTKNHNQTELDVQILNCLSNSIFIDFYRTCNRVAESRIWLMFEMCWLSSPLTWTLTKCIQIVFSTNFWLSWLAFPLLHTRHSNFISFSLSSNTLVRVQIPSHRMKCVFLPIKR